VDNSTEDAPPSLWERVLRTTIWHPDALPPEEHKYRQQKRIYFPLYAAIVIGAGIWAVAYGSPVLHRLFDEDTIDFMGMVLAASGMLLLCGSVLPTLWHIAFGGNVLIMLLLGTYAAAVMFFRLNPDPSAGFIVFILALGLIVPPMHLSILGEEIKERRAERAAPSTADGEE
jgi:hypothetical protein